MYGFKVRRQYGIDNFIIDFYCPKLQLAIEVDGEVHYFKDKKITDKKQDETLISEGIKIIRLKNKDLYEDYESIVVYLEDIFKKRARELGVPFNDDQV
ncbi:hypothetical protein BH23BAC3_BH23BAC3_02690 [soil metagenome]